MPNFKKSFNFKIILLIAVCVFLLDSAGYCKAMPGADMLRVPMATNSRRLDDARSRLPRAIFDRENRPRHARFALIKVATQVTGVQFLDTTSVAPWFLSRLKLSINRNLETYANEILDEKGDLKPEYRKSVEELFNKIIITCPSNLRSRVSFTTLLDRHRDEFMYFKDVVLPLLISMKNKKGEKDLKVKVMGVSAGEELATIYFYIEQAFSEHPEWGEMSTWDIEIHGIDILIDMLNEASERLLKYPERLSVLFGRDREIVSSLQRVSFEEKQGIFKFSHGNIAYKKHRAQFLEKADIIFANIVLHYILSSVREQVARDMLDTGAAILTTTPSVYEICVTRRSAVQIPIKFSPSPEHRYAIAPLGEEFTQPELGSFSFHRHEFEIEDLFDNPGEFLPTHIVYDTARARRDYNRTSHVRNLEQAIIARQIQLSPYTISGLKYVLSKPRLSAKYGELAKRLLNATMEASKLNMRDRLKRTPTDI